MTDREFIFRFALAEMAYARKLRNDSETMLKKSLVLSESALQHLKEALDERSTGKDEV